MTEPWWATAVFYEVYVPSFADTTGSGEGDLPGITAHLDHLVRLGVDAVWLTPFYPSPMADNGYDVADPRDVDPRFGSLADLDALLAAAHVRGLRVVVDVVPNHFSDQHPWFRQALADGPGSPARQRFLFRDGRGAGGAEPPNDWQSTFGGPAWTRVPDGQWYLHLFAPGQPDLDWRHPDVPADFELTLRFWLDRGVDGFRIDVAHGMFKAEALPDLPPGPPPNLLADRVPATPMWNQPEVHDVFRAWRALCDSYPQRPMLVGEVWIGDPAEQARYVRPDELHLAFNFRVLFAPWDGPAMADALDRSVVEQQRVGAAPTWVLSNHDVVRHVTRYGGGAVGLARARAGLLLELALPGAVFLYQGEELGLEEVVLPDEALRDPIWESSGHTVRGRDGCRVPLPWSGTTPPYGFSPDGTTTWLPQPDDWAASTVASEPSVLRLYREALRLRPRTGAGVPLTWHRRDEVLDLTTGVRCVVNTGAQDVPMPAGELLIASGPVDGVLPPDTAVWLRAGG